MAPFTILITGASAGFGLLFAQHALSKGHKVIATARNVSKAKESNPDIEQRGGIWLALDVTKPDTREKISKAVSEYGVNVVINNAGYAHVGLLEDASADDIDSQFRTNVFGVIAVCQGAIPYFRSRKSGIIVNISSIVAEKPGAGASLYSATKGTIDALTEALALEVAPFGIKVLNITPGAFRTRFLASNSAVISKYNKDYEGTAGAQTINGLAQFNGNQPGDPQKGVERMLDFIVAEGEGRQRLFIGSDAKGAVEHAVQKLQADWKASEEAAMSCDIEK